MKLYEPAVSLKVVDVFAPDRAIATPASIFPRIVPLMEYSPVFFVAVKLQLVALPPLMVIFLVRGSKVYPDRLGVIVYEPFNLPTKANVPSPPLVVAEDEVPDNINATPPWTAPDTVPLREYELVV